jgi:hypothetical protein
MKTTGLNFFYLSDLKKFGVTEDGEDFIGEIFIVYAEDGNGNRWAHKARFNGVKVEESEWGTGFVDTRENARRCCDFLVNRFRNSDRLWGSMWSEARPAYGSEAYIEYGQADDLAWEKEMG